MVNKPAKGTRSKTRGKFSRRDIPAPSVNKLLANFEIGDRVQVHIDPSIHSGMPHRRYQGLSGVVIAKQGWAFKIELAKQNKMVKLIVGAVHLKKLKTTSDLKVAA